MDPFQDRLKLLGRTFFGLHDIGEDEMSALGQDSADFGEDARAVRAVEQGVLGPDHVHHSVRERQLFKVPVDDVDHQAKVLGAVQVAVPLVLCLAQVQTGHVTAKGFGQVASGAAVAGADVQDA